MDKVSPDFASTLVETKSWTDGDCDSVEEQNIEITTSSPTTFTKSSQQIAEAHSVVDIHSIPLEEESRSDCSVAEVFTPRLSSNQDDSPATTRPSSVEPLQQVEESSLHGAARARSISTDESDLQPPAKRVSISTYPDQITDEVNSIEQMQASAPNTPSPMLFGSFVAPGKADPNIVVSLEGADLWHQFYQAGTEMIITKSGR